MEYRALGASGLRASARDFGAGTFGGSGPLFPVWGDTGEADARRLVDIALAARVNFSNTADVYADGASETVLGAVLSGGQRPQAVPQLALNWLLQRPARPTCWSARAMPRSWSRTSAGRAGAHAGAGRTSRRCQRHHSALPLLSLLERHVRRTFRAAGGPAPPVVVMTRSLPRPAGERAQPRSRASRSSRASCHQVFP